MWLSFGDDIETDPPRIDINPTKSISCWITHVPALSTTVIVRNSGRHFIRCPYCLPCAGNGDGRKAGAWTQFPCALRSPKAGDHTRTAEAWGWLSGVPE